MTSSKKKEKMVRVKEIEQGIIQLEEAYKVSLSQHDYNKILKLKSEYNSFLEGEIGSLLQKN